MSYKEIIYIDLDNVVFDYDTARNEALAKTPDIRWPQSQCGFFLNLKPIEGAIEGVRTLFEDDRFDCWFLSAPSVINPLSYTEKRLSIERHFGLEYAKKLILSPDKSLLKGDFLIDDNVKGKGQDKFQGYLIHFGSEHFETWKQVSDLFFGGWHIISKSASNNNSTLEPVPEGYARFDGKIYKI